MTKKSDDVKTAPSPAPRASPAVTIVGGSTSIANAAALFLARTGLAVYVDNRVGAAAGTQAAATPLVAPVTRVTIPVTNGSFVLPNVNGTSRPMEVVNDSGQPIAVFCASGENMNGSSNTSLTIGNGQHAQFKPVTVDASGGGSPDWRSGLFS
jgi:hypothetical protein